MRKPDTIPVPDTPNVRSGIREDLCDQTFLMSCRCQAYLLVHVVSGLEKRTILIKWRRKLEFQVQSVLFRARE